MPIRVAINGFGRIGRSFFRQAAQYPDIEVVAINDLAEVENLIYLLKYDSAYGPAQFDVRAEKVDWRTMLVADGVQIPVYKEKDPTELPWDELGVDIVVEATGAFTKYEKARVHLAAGAKRVVVSAPIKDEPPTDLKGATVLMGINDDALQTCDISSGASCTTNGVGPVIEIIHEAIGIEKAMLNTVHGYTATQALVDGPDAKDFRRGRAGAVNIIPSSTGAAKAVTQVITDLHGKFDGIALRVPVVTGSVADATFITKRNTSVEEINGVLREAAGTDRWNKYFAVTDEPIVSTDIIGSTHASIADLGMTRVVDGNLVKVLAWYDNESGYTRALIEHVLVSGSHLKK